jgi:hypothetical protein
LDFGGRCEIYNFTFFQIQNDNKLLVSLAKKQADALKILREDVARSKKQLKDLEKMLVEILHANHGKERGKTQRFQTVEAAGHWLVSL